MIATVSCPCCGETLELTVRHVRRGGLSGKDLQQAIAARIQELGWTDPFHYMDLMECSTGMKLNGLNRTATFLTNLTRVDGIQRVGRGTYIYHRPKDTP